MFLARRSAQAEYFDAPERTASELADHYVWLNRVNRVTRFDRPFRMWIPRLLPEADCRDLTVLDVGAGDGELGRTLSSWAGQQGWSWKFTDLDLSSHACALNPNPRATVGSATALPFPDRSFDVVVATTMTHHLPEDADVVAHFREAARVARRLVLVCDMQRSALFLGALGLFLWLHRVPREFREDGLLSVRRGWRVEEWQRMAAAAGLVDARVWSEHGTRVLLSVQKKG
jgi:ubiquinone/menaquinone biosynthesis C-methylase UbiE